MKAGRPEEIGGYRILAALGRGGMGAVYRARDGDGRTVALKLLHAHLDEPEARERLRREVRVLQKVRHKGVARVLDAEIDSTEAFVVTELVAGRDLAKTVRQRGPFPPAELAELAARLRDALAVVHKAGVLHRDLTPGNIMITPDGPVLIDFGLAQAVEDARVTSTGLVTGTPGYVAPELLEGDQPSVASDWWGWAAVLTFAATGKPPFGKGAIGAVLTRVRAGEPALAGLGAATAEALRGALAVEPGDRTAPTDVIAALEAAAAEPDEEPEEEADEAAAEAAAEEAAAEPAEGAVEEAGEAGEEPAEEEPAEPAADDEADEPTADEADEPADDEAGVVATRVLGARDGGTAVLPAGGAVALEEATRADAGEDLGDYGEVYAEDDEEYADEYAEDYPGEDGEEYADEYGDEYADEYGEEYPARPSYVPPEPARRVGTVAALGLPFLAFGLARPGAALAAAAVVAVLVRSVGLDIEGLHRRRVRHGERPADVAGAALIWPWYLVRAVLGVVPAVVVGAAVMVMVGGVVWWLTGAGHVVVAAPGPDEPVGVIAHNAVWVGRAAVGLLVAIGLAMLWFGPMARATRTGARWVLAGVAPGRTGALVAVVVGLAVAAVLAATMLGQDVVWWPLGGPPDLG